MHVYTNHMGYNARGSKKAVFQGEEGVAASAFRVLDQAGKTVYEGVPAKVGTVAKLADRLLLDARFYPCGSAWRLYHRGGYSAWRCSVPCRLKLPDAFAICGS